MSGTRHVALLRGINVGGHRRVEMARLRAMMEELGYSDVRTYVQSGNVVFSAPGRAGGARAAARHERAIGEGISATFGLGDVPVVVRSAAELEEVVAGDPFGAVATEPKHYHVLFLAKEPAAGCLDGVDAAAHAPAAFHLAGRHVYLWTPGGIRDSKLAKAVSEARLGVTATARNWRTVEKLLAMAAGEA